MSTMTVSDLNQYTGELLLGCFVGILLCFIILWQILSVLSTFHAAYALARSEVKFEKQLAIEKAKRGLS
jgi:hypothetical protein